MIRYQFTSDLYHFYSYQIYTDFTANYKIKPCTMTETPSYNFLFAAMNKKSGFTEQDHIFGLLFTIGP